MPEQCSSSRAQPAPAAAQRKAQTAPVARRLDARPGAQAAGVHAAQLNARAANRTGLPDRLKSGMEAVSRISLDDVRVHRNSAKPAQLEAHAYAQGSQIYLGPGQERHLAHEVSHVVQQKQGRVRATAQAQGVPINDDASLEREADIMGARAVSGALAGGAAGAQPAQLGAGAAPVQRKARFLLKQAPLPMGMAGVSAILIRLREAKREFGDKLPSLAMVPGLPNLLRDMMQGETEHGTFDLDSEQGVGLLSFELQRLAAPPKPSPSVGSTGSGGSGGKTLGTTPQSGGARSGGILETVFLGAGASIAYYLAAGRGQYSPGASIIIGQADPWAGKRGPGVVAHPESMITPMLEFLGQKIDSVWTERGRFAQLVAEVIKISGLPLIHEAVVSVDETPQGHYLIRTDKGGTITARNIVSGMGTGEHSLPKVDASLVAASDKEVAADPQQGGAVAKRVMNMDVFTQIADRLYGDSGGKILLAPMGKAVPGRKARAGIHMVLSGGNGGIDVAFSGLQKGFKVTWLVGPGEPSFLEGFFNYAARYAYDRSPQVRPGAGTAIAPAESPQRIEVIRKHLEALYRGQEHILLRDAVDHFAGSARFEAVHFGYAGAVAVKGNQVGVQVVAGDGKAMDPVSGDLFVYAHGQDGSALRIFGGLLPRMAPLIDKNLHFLNPDSRESPAVKGGQKPQETVLGMTHISKSGGSIKLIGAAGYRHRDQRVKGMAPVINSLPPNVLLNDQLTPSRSQIEAQLDYVRPNAGSFADFITDDRTQLAVHIAARYPYIPSGDVEKHVAMIILSRRAGIPGKKEITAVPPNSMAFQRFWEMTLTRLDRKAEIEAKAKAEIDAKARVRAATRRSKL